MTTNVAIMFIYTLPILFSYTHWLAPTELIFIFTALFVVLLVFAPVPAESWQTSLHGYLFAAWIGRLPIHWVFLPFFLLLNGCLYASDTLVKLGLLTVSSWDEIHFIFLLAIIWWTTAVWRCSANATSRWWGALARLMTLAVFFEYGLKLLIRIDFPRVFFNCEDLLLNYGSCF